jgi:hypothetical protein
MDYIDVTRAFGVATIIISLGFLFNLRHYEEMAKRMVGGPTGFVMGGILPVIIGSLLLNFHQEWSFSWAATLTVIGWLLFLVGIFRIWFVNLWIKLIKANIRFVPILFAVFGLIFGVMLCFAGYVVPLMHHAVININLPNI